MMRVGGSIFSKYCRRDIRRDISSSGSRKWFSSSSSKEKIVDEIKNVDKAISVICASIILNGAVMYGAYRYGLYMFPYDPEKYASNQESLVIKEQLLNNKCKGLEKKEALIGQLEEQMIKKKREELTHKMKKIKEAFLGPLELTKRRCIIKLNYHQLVTQSGSVELTNGTFWSTMRADFTRQSAWTSSVQDMHIKYAGHER